MEKEKYILLVAGPSGSGKSFFAETLSKTKSLPILQSYTTRSPRYEGETGHVFVTKEEFDSLPDKCAYTLFDGNEYCATSKQVDEASIYIIDPAGIDYFTKNYTGVKKPFVVIVECNDKEKLIQRMMTRQGGTVQEAAARAWHDTKAFYELTEQLIENQIPFVVVENDRTKEELVESIETFASWLDETGVVI